MEAYRENCVLRGEPGFRYSRMVGEGSEEGQNGGSLLVLGECREVEKCRRWGCTK